MLKQGQAVNHHLLLGRVTFSVIVKQTELDYPRPTTFDIEDICAAWGFIKKKEFFRSAVSYLNSNTARKQKTLDVTIKFVFDGDNFMTNKLVMQ